jgi:hypothetical protein
MMCENPIPETHYITTTKIPSFLCNPKVQYCVQRSLSLVPILSQKNPVNTLPSYFFKISFNINLPSMPGLPNKVCFLDWVYTSTCNLLFSLSMIPTFLLQLLWRLCYVSSPLLRAILCCSHSAACQICLSTNQCPIFPDIKVYLGEWR